MKISTPMGMEKDSDVAGGSLVVKNFHNHESPMVSLWENEVILIIMLIIILPTILHKIKFCIIIKMLTSFVDTTRAEINS